MLFELTIGGRLNRQEFKGLAVAGLIATVPLTGLCERFGLTGSLEE
jgi:hypothetical protein